MQSKMFPLSTLSVIEFTGLDAGQFLHNQLSADINGLAIGDAGFACCCNPQGRVLGLLLLTVREQSILAICASELAESLHAWLSRFVIRAKVEIALRPDLLVAAISSNETGSVETLVDAGIGLKYAIVPSADLEAQENGVTAKTWKIEELKTGVAWLGAETTAQFLPQMLGYESIGALSFKKGCYPGQEIIARTRYLGKLKRRLFLLHTSEPTRAGIMEKIELHNGADSYTGVVVDRVEGAASGDYLFTVIRSSEDIEIDAITVGERKLEAVKH